MNSIATAFADAIAGWDDCGAVAETQACIGCVGRNERCAGTSVGPAVLGCCDPNDVCVERNARVSRCKASTWTAPSSWTGTIRSCNENEQTEGPPLID